MRVILCLVFCLLPSASSADSGTPAPSFAAEEALSVEPFQAPGDRNIMGVRCLLQDRRGFLWACSNSGLMRYDGYEIRVYGHDPADPSSLSGNLPQTIIETADGDMWIGAWSGLNRFDRESDSFVRWRHDPDDPQSLGLSQVNVIVEDRAGILWLGGMGRGVQAGLERFDPDAGRFDYFPLGTSDPNRPGRDSVGAILEDSQGALWIGSLGQGLFRFDPETRHFQQYRHDPDDPSSLTSDRIYALHEGDDGRLWIGTWNGLNSFDGLRFTHHRAPGVLAGAESDQIQSIYPGSSEHPGRLLLGAASGLHVFDPNEGMIGRVLEDAVRSMVRDREGALWIGTLSDGLYKSDPESRQFARIRLETPAGERNRRADTARSVAQDHDGTLWIGTDLGLVRIDPAADLKPPRQTRYLHDPNDPAGLGRDSIWSVYVDRRNEVWVGTLGAGVHRFDRRSGGFVRYSHGELGASRATNHVYDLYEDSTGTLLAGTRHGVQRLDREARRFVDLKPRCTQVNVLDLLEDQHGDLWMATMGEGVCRKIRRTGEILRYGNDPADPTSLAHNVVLAMHEDRRGRLWLATHGGGLDRYDRDTDAFIHHDEWDLPGGRSVYALLEDEESGDLWIRTGLGLVRLDPETGESSLFGPGDGVLPAEGPYGFAAGAHGEMFFGAVGGINVFRPQEIRLHLDPPPVEITDFSVFHRPVPIGAGSVLERAITETDALTLSYDERTVSFKLAALSFRFPQGNRFRYRLNGHDADWIEVDGERRFVTYTNLDPGDYVFRVRASNHHGAWNEEGRSLAVSFAPPWWGTWRFRGFVAVVVLALATIVHRWRMNMLRSLHRAEVRMHQVQKMEAFGRLAGAVAHDFNNLLTVVLGNAVLLRKKRGDSAELEGIEKASLSGKALTAQLLSFVREEEDVRPQILDLDAVIGESEGLLRRVLPNEVRLEVRLAGDLPPIRADVVRLQQVLMNLTVNAGDAMPEGGDLLIETADAAQVAVSDKSPGDGREGVLLRVSDDGVGMDEDVRTRLFEPFFTTKESGKGTGLGLSTVFTTVRRADGEIEVDSRPGEGTVFEIFLPACEGAVAEPRPADPESTRTDDEIVLLVDDEAPTRFVTGLLLSRAGYEVLTARDGPEAIRIFQDAAGAVSLVVLDNSMPEMDGRSVHDVLAEHRPEMPFLFCTGSRERDFPEGFFEHPLRRLMTKPFEEERLLAEVRSLLESAPGSFDETNRA